MLTLLITTVFFAPIELSPATANFQSQYGQDKFVYTQFFQHKKDGTFVDIGAHDGVSKSNTYFFERTLGWQGICIEPLPEMYSKLIKNRNCICINGCISSSNEPAQFLAITGYSDMLSGLIEKYDPEHLKRIEDELKLYGGEKRTITVNCYTLNELLIKYNLQSIDYLSIDTEGNEYEILETIDYERFNIDVIDVENNYGDNRIYNLLTKKGYKRITYIGIDEIYKKAR